MSDLFSNIEFDPVVSSVGLVVILLGIRLVFGAFKTAVKLLFLLVVLIGLYLFFYGGVVTG